jgi:Fe-S-cluster-containing hydrogenase component 2
MYTFELRTGHISIDHTRCIGCTTLACVEACRRYGSAVLKAEAGRPVLAIPRHETKRRDIECLACEIACCLRGHQAITISLPIAGLEEWKSSAHGHSVG